MCEPNTLGPGSLGLGLRSSTLSVLYPSEVREIHVVVSNLPVHFTSAGACATSIPSVSQPPVDFGVFLLQLMHGFVELLLAVPHLIGSQHLGSVGASCRPIAQASWWSDLPTVAFLVSAR